MTENIFAIHHSSVIVDDTETAQAALKNNGFTVGKTQVVAVEVPDRPGGLHQILMMLHEAKINVEYMYAFVNKSGENAVLIFRFDDMDKAMAALQRDNFTILTGEQVCAL